MIISVINMSAAADSTNPPSGWGGMLESVFPAPKGSFYSDDLRTFSLIYPLAERERLDQCLKDFHVKVYTSRGKARSTSSGTAAQSTDEQSNGDRNEDGESTRRAKRLVSLGKVGPGILGNRNQMYLPAASSYEYIGCLKVDIHSGYKHQSQRASYVNKAESCELQMVRRGFKELELIVISVRFGQHYHTCSTFNDHLLPMKKGEMSFIILGLLKHGSSKVFYEKDFGQLLKRRRETNQRMTRFDALMPADLERIARKCGISNAPRQGPEDVERVRQFLLACQTEGATVIYKPPGVASHHPSVILDDDARQYVRDNDCVFLIMTKLQKEVLRELGTMVATDGTHAIFSYTNVKVIAVTVTSFKPHSQMRERGFPVAIAIVSSEREDIQRAIVVTLRKAIPNWTPRLLMTDMAFSAFNAWSAEFPNLSWLWCVFHVWQAWIRKLRSLANPGGIEQSEWLQVKGYLISAVKNLICPKSRITIEEWRKTSELVLRVLLWCGASDAASSWASYFKKEELWAHPHRWAVINSIYDDLDELPMLARSNNVTESFFCVLKYHILDGKSLRTFSQFLALWTAYEPRLIANLTRANVYHHLLNCASATGEDLDESQLQALEEDLETDEDNIIRTSSTTESDGDVNDEDGDESSVSTSNSLATTYAQNEASTRRRWKQEALSTLDRIALLRDALAADEEDPEIEYSKNVVLLGEALETRLRNMRLSSAIMQALPFTDKIEAFVRQIDNFDTTSFETVKAKLLAEATLPKPGTVDQCAVPSTMVAESLSALQSADMSSLNKKKRVKSEQSVSNPHHLPSITFTEFAQRLLENPEAQLKIQRAQQELQSSGLCALRAVLMMNTRLRIFSVMKAVFDVVLPEKRKADMVSIALGTIASKVQLVESIAAEVADFGYVHSADTVFNVGEVILLKANSTASTGERCVAACQSLSGWVIRDAQPVFYDDINAQVIHWAHLIERRKETSIIF